MHELSIIAGLFDTLLEQAGKHHARGISLVTIRVGKLAGVVPDLLESAFDMYKKDTIASEAKLAIETAPLRIRCRACGNEAEIQSFVFLCSACGSPDLEILQGTELVLEKIELETDG